MDNSSLIARDFLTRTQKRSPEAKRLFQEASTELGPDPRDSPPRYNNDSVMVRLNN